MPIMWLTRDVGTATTRAPESFKRFGAKGPPRQAYDPAGVDVYAAGAILFFMRGFERIQCQPPPPMPVPPPGIPVRERGPPRRPPGFKLFRFMYGEEAEMNPTRPASGASERDTYRSCVYLKGMQFHVPDDGGPRSAALWDHFCADHNQHAPDYVPHPWQPCAVFKDLIHRMLEKDQARRITMRSALDHEWLQLPDAPDADFLTDMRERYKYRAEGPFNKSLRALLHQ